jgi:hypothetical protein
MPSDNVLTRGLGNITDYLEEDKKRKAEIEKQLKDKYGTAPRDDEGFPDWDNMTRKELENYAGKLMSREPNIYGNPPSNFSKSGIGQQGNRNGNGDFRYIDEEGRDDLEHPPTDEYMEWIGKKNLKNLEDQEKKDQNKLEKLNRRALEEAMNDDWKGYSPDELREFGTQIATAMIKQDPKDDKGAGDLMSLFESLGKAYAFGKSF